MFVPDAETACGAPVQGHTALLDPDWAVDVVLEQVPARAAAERPLGQSLGLVLADNVRSSTNQPPFTRALMDGFAVRLADAGRATRIAEVIAAGHPAAVELAPGTAAEIMTGAPCPPGSEAVVRVEDTTRVGDQVQLPERIRAGQNIQLAGALCRQGEMVLARGTRLTPIAMAAAAASGALLLPVLAPPSMVLITTGDELRAAGSTLGDAAIRDSNGPMLVAMAQQAGVTDVRLTHALDDATSLTARIDEAAAADLLVLSGGVSMGRRDLVPAVLRELGARILFHKVRQQPGKPLLFAVRGQQLVFGLPGTPLGSHLGFHRYVGAAIRRWLGQPARPRVRRGTLSAPLRAHSDRVHFRLVRASRSVAGWRIDPVRWLGSSDVVGPALANGYCRFEPGTHELDAGTELEWEAVGEGASMAVATPREPERAHRA